MGTIERQRQPEPLHAAQKLSTPQGYDSGSSMASCKIACFIFQHRKGTIQGHQIGIRTVADMAFQHRKGAIQGMYVAHRSMTMVIFQHCKGAIQGLHSRHKRRFCKANSVGQWHFRHFGVYFRG